MYTLQELQPKIIQWAKDKDLVKLENAFKQASKTQEELDEMKIHIYLQKMGVETYTKNNETVIVADAIMDDIGDQLITLIIQCAIQEIDLLDCLNLAWNEIKDRKGETKNGVFIKN